MARGKYRFHEVSRAPDESGVYAWYCRYELPKRNIEDLLAELSLASLAKKRELVRAFLQRYLFKYFEECPYEVTLKAPLKPRYEGSAAHVSSVSSALVDRFVDQPNRLEVLADILRMASPEFASPIYIGSAKSLRSRLITHVNLIRKYRQGLLGLQPDDFEALTAEQRADHSFAREAAAIRRFDPNDLWVYTLQVGLGHEYTFDLENILNRINFPSAAETNNERESYTCPPTFSYHHSRVFLIFQ